MKTRRLLVLIFALGATSLSWAQTLSYSDFFGSSGTPIAVANFPQTLSLPKFDSTLGTLTGITLTLEATESTVIAKVINLVGGNQAFNNVTAQLNLILTAPGSAVVSVSPSAGPYNGTAFGPAFNFTVAGMANVGLLSNSVSIAPASFSLYVGSGSNSGSVIIDGSVTSAGTSSPGTVAFFGDGSTYGHVTIEYAYTAIPESSDYALLAGLTVLAAAVRRFRALRLA